MRETLQKLRTQLIPLYGEGEARAIIRLIFHSLKGWTATDMIVHEGDTLSDYIRNKINEIIVRLKCHEPIQYILGETDFYGLKLKVGPGTLIPRPETAELVDIIVEQHPIRDVSILDIGTGSGAIALALARTIPFSKVTGIDISPIAIENARQNANNLKVKVDFFQQDIFSFSTSTSWDIIVSNPPYVLESEKISMEENVLGFEPSEALFVPDNDPLKFYRGIIVFAVSHLNEGGKIYFEINPLVADKLMLMLRDFGFVNIDIRKDMFGKDRFIIAGYDF